MQAGGRAGSVGSTLYRCVVMLPLPLMARSPRGTNLSAWVLRPFTTASLTCMQLGKLLLSMRLATFTVSPRKQYRGHFMPMTPAYAGPQCTPAPPRLVCYCASSGGVKIVGGGGGWVCGKMGWETEGLGDGGGGRRRGWQGEGGLCGTTPCLFLLGWGGWTMWGRGGGVAPLHRRTKQATGCTCCMRMSALGAHKRCTPHSWPITAQMVMQ